MATVRLSWPHVRVEGANESGCEALVGIDGRRSVEDDPRQVIDQAGDRPAMELVLVMAAVANAGSPSRHSETCRCIELPA